MTLRHRFSWLPDLDRRVWLLSFGRLLSQFGNGFVLFYAPIFFVNQVGLSATAVGIGLGSGSVSGVVGRFLGGTAADSPQWGRRKTLLWSAAIAALADVGLVLADDLPLFIVANLLMGLGIGLYWPAAEAMVADLTKDSDRSEAFALVRLADSVGLSLGVALGGMLVALTESYRALFVIDGVTYLLFFAIIYVAIAEVQKSQVGKTTLQEGWRLALTDLTLWIYVSVNILFTTYLAQVQTTLPLYLKNVASGGVTTAQISALFTWHVVLTAVCQLPVARSLRRWPHPRTLALSALVWGAGFGGLWLAGTSGQTLVWGAVALAVLAVATVIYLPAASAYVVELAPEAQRGIYLSINSQCWAVGYFVGPPLGGWFMDQPATVAHRFWPLLGLTTLVAVGVLGYLSRRDAGRASKERSA
ncbi:MAG: MFS transporter [Cyanobacteria bacterium P01_A01_bin.135]